MLKARQCLALLVNPNALFHIHTNMNNKEIADSLKSIGFKDDLNRFRLRTLKMTYRSWSFYTVSKGVLAASENETFCLLLEKKWSSSIKASIKLRIDNLSPSYTQLSLF